MTNEIVKLNQTERDVLEKELGPEMTKLVIEQANAQGKELEEQNVAFKSTPTTFTKETLLVLGAIKQLTQEREEAKKELSEYRQQVKDLGNQVAQMLEAFGGTIDTNKRTQESVTALEESVKALVERRPAASKSSQTQIADGDKHADFLEKKNKEDGEERMSIVSQMKTMNNGGL